MASARASSRFTRLSEATGDLLPPQRGVLVEGVLRRGHKMLVAGPPKAGKTWLSIALAYAIANGHEVDGSGRWSDEGASWLGHRCARGEVCLVDGEMDPASFYHRCDLVARAMFPHETEAERRARGARVNVMHLRGDHDTDVDGLTLMLMEEYDGSEPPAVVIIDPIYKLLSGDENSNSEMRGFLKQTDALAAWGPSVVTTHHHAKGAAGGRAVTDRAAGAGAFSRDPDAFIDLTPLDVREGTEAWGRLERALPMAGGETGAQWQDRLRSATLLRANHVLREFPDRWGTELLFDFPLMVPVDGFSDVPEEGSAEAARSAGAQANADAADERWDELDLLVQEAVEAVEARGATPTRRAVHEELRRVCAEDGEVPCPTFKAFEKATKPSGRSAWGASPEAPYGLLRKTAAQTGRTP